MKRTLISLAVAGLFAGSAPVLLAQNVTADEKAGTTPKSTEKIQKEMTNPTPDAKAAPESSSHQKRAAAFEKADKDHSGTLSKAEAKDMAGLTQNFKAIDTNKDGALSMAEVDAYLDARAKASTK